MSLGQFVPSARGKAGSFDPRYNADKPLIVVPREFRPDFATRRFPDPRDVIIVDIVDVLADTVHVSVIWGSAAIVDQLKHYAPTDGQGSQKLPMSIKLETSAAGNQYATIVPLEDKGLAVAQAWDAKYPTRIDDERQTKETEDAAAAARPKTEDQNTTDPLPLNKTTSGASISDEDLEAALASLK